MLTRQKSIRRKGQRDKEVNREVPRHRNRLQVGNTVAYVKGSLSDKVRNQFESQQLPKRAVEKRVWKTMKEEVGKPYDRHNEKVAIIDLVEWLVGNQARTLDMMKEHLE